MEAVHPHRFVVAVVGLVALLAGALGVLRAGAEGAGEDLPELPAVDERFEDLYDGDGCLRTGVDQRDCTTTADQVADALAGDDESDVRHLEGFVGSHWLDDPVAATPVVLEDTARVHEGGALRLTGLVRNETEHTLTAIQVAATVRAADGSVLAELVAPALVGPVRSGEPVPFLIEGEPLDRPVATVEWSASAVAAEPGRRDLHWQAYWEQPAGLRDPLENHLYGESGAGPHPHVAFGSVQNLGAEPVRAVSVHAVWLDGSGAVAAMTHSDAVDPAGAVIDSLAPGAAGDALLISPDVPVGAPALVWVSGS